MLCKVLYKKEPEGNTNEDEDVVPNHHPSWIDDDNHIIVFAKIKQAYVKSPYWNVTQKLFQPQCRGGLSAGTADTTSVPPPPPYLTFFGSQTFGYVSSQPL
jgi:hypothetical protein